MTPKDHIRDLLALALLCAALAFIGLWVAL